MTDLKLLSALRGQGRFAPIDGLRGVAVLLVFLIHYRAILASRMIPGSFLSGFSEGMAQVGYTGVDVFFALSGFLIYGGLIRKGGGYTTFLARRVKRIFPAFLTVLGIYLVLSVLFPGRSRIPTPIFEAARYVMANILLLPGIFPIRPILTVAWTLSYEFLFYLTVPILVGVLGLRRRSSGERLAMLGISVVILEALTQYGWNRYGEMLMFFAGMAAFELNEWSSAAAYRTAAAEAVTTALCVTTIALIATGARVPGFWPGQVFFGAFRSYLLFISLTLLVWCATGAKGMIPSALAWFPLRVLGAVSYSFYLIHGLVLNGISAMLQAFVPKDTGLWILTAGLFPVALAAAVIASVLLFVWIEYPFSVRRKGWERPSIGIGKRQEDC